MKKNKTLLIGNGLNRLSDDGSSWESLLNKLDGKPRTNHEVEIRKAKPFTLWFEEISSLKDDEFLKSIKKGNKSLKGIISDHLAKSVKPNFYHKRIMQLGCQNILTTNYDYNLENSSDEKWEINNSSRETLFSLFRRHSSGVNNIWHIHGELEPKNSIMLGHDHYSGYIHKVRNFLTTGVETQSKGRKGGRYLSKFSFKNDMDKGDTESWVDIFLENEIHIMGFSLDYTENHLWNLISEKKKLKRKNRGIGKVIYHRCSDSVQSTADEAKLSILNAFGVEVIDHVEETYGDAYEKCINFLETNIFKPNKSPRGK